jgi:hypothetical protein
MLGSAVAGGIIALMLALAVIVVIVLIAGLVVRARRRGRLHQGDWDAGARDACATGEALYDRLATQLTPAQSAGADGRVPVPWSDTERRMDELGAKLHALRFNAPSYTTDQAVEELVMALAALRSAMQVEHGAHATASVPAGEPVSTAQARLMEFDSAVRALRVAI